MTKPTPPWKIQNLYDDDPKINAILQRRGKVWGCTGIQKAPFCSFFGTWKISFGKGEASAQDSDVALFLDSAYNDIGYLVGQIRELRGEKARLEREVKYLTNLLNWQRELREVEKIKQWSEDFPTEEGYYWVRSKNNKAHAFLVKITETPLTTSQKALWEGYLWSKCQGDDAGI